MRASISFAYITRLANELKNSVNVLQYVANPAVEEEVLRLNKIIRGLKTVIDNPMMYSHCKEGKCTFQDEGKASSQNQ